MESPERIRDPGEGRGLVGIDHRKGAAFDEPRHEVSLGPDEGDHLRADPNTSRGHGRRMLHLPADTEQVRVVAGEADHVADGLSGRLDQVIPVRDPAR
jgi:hypothetical protein